MTLKIKDKKLFGRNCILDNFITRKFELHEVFLWIKDPDPVFSLSRFRIRITPKDRIRPDPQHLFEVDLNKRRFKVELNKRRFFKSS